MRRLAIRAAFGTSLIGIALAACAAAQEIVEFPIPSAGPGGVNRVGGFAVGKDGSLWFTMNSYALLRFGGSIEAGGDLALIADDGSVTEFPDPCSVSRAPSAVGGPAATADFPPWPAGTRQYSNAAGTPFQPVQDTAAFSCP